MTIDSSVPTPARKPPKPRFEKPSPDFPLSIHQGTGYWCKKVRGVVYYFGKVVDDPKGVAALAQWEEEKEDLLAGREPGQKTAGAITLEKLCFKFLEYQEGRLNQAEPEIRHRTFYGYKATCERLAVTIGRHRLVADLKPKDFAKLRAELAKDLKLVALRNELIRILTVFNFGVKVKLIDSKPDSGVYLDLPKKESIDAAREVHKAEHGDRMFEADQLRMILDYVSGKDVSIIDKKTKERIVVKGEADTGLKAIILLAINCAFGQADISELPLPESTKHLNLETGWLNYPRVKTRVPRLIPLWPETVEAIREWIKIRPKAKNPEDRNLLFLTPTGQRWFKLNKKGSPNDALGRTFLSLLNTLQLKREKVGFYGIRHSFETIGGETLDQVTVDALMGHKPKGMGANYRERIGNDRRVRVVNHVRAWLFGELPKDGGQVDDTNGSIISIDSRSSEPENNAGQSAVLRLFVG